MQTKISAKAHRKVAREIKTARTFAFQLQWGQKHLSFVLGKTMEDLDEYYEFDDYNTRRTFVDTVEKEEDPVEA